MTPLALWICSRETDPRPWLYERKTDPRLTETGIRSRSNFKRRGWHRTKYNTGWDNSGIWEWVGLHHLSNLLPCIKKFVLRRTGCKPNWPMDFGVDDNYERFQVVGFPEATLPAWKFTNVTLCRFNLTPTALRTLFMPVNNTLRRVNLRNCVRVLERVAATDFGGGLAKLQQGRVRDDDATPVMLKHLDHHFSEVRGVFAGLDCVDLSDPLHVLIGYDRVLFNFSDRQGVSLYLSHGGDRWE